VHAMLKDLHKWFKKRNWRRTFLVHYIVYTDDFSLDAYIQELQNSYKLRIVKGAHTNNQSIEIRIRPKQLYEVLRELPNTVAVSYEIKEPGKR
jgi:hypothetical protein